MFEFVICARHWLTTAKPNSLPRLNLFDIQIKTKRGPRAAALNFPFLAEGGGSGLTPPSVARTENGHFSFPWRPPSLPPGRRGKRQRPRAATLHFPSISERREQWHYFPLRLADGARTLPLASTAALHFPPLTSSQPCIPLPGDPLAAPRRRRRRRSRRHRPRRPIARPPRASHHLVTTFVVAMP